MWDRGLHSYAMVQATVDKGCDYLGRIPANVKFLAELPLEDSSYLSWIYPSGKLRKKGLKPIQVRVIEYNTIASRKTRRTTDISFDYKPVRY
jgi:hypothetical protein